MNERRAWVCVGVMLVALLSLLAWDVATGPKAWVAPEPAAPTPRADTFRPEAEPRRYAPRAPLRVAGEPLHVTALVIDETGAPVAGARVTFVPSGDTLHAMGLDPPEYCDTWYLGTSGEDLGWLDLAAFPGTTSDAAGRFALDGHTLSVGDDVLPEGETRAGPPENLLLVTGDGRAVRWEHCAATLAPPEYDAGALVLPREALVEGRVVDPSGATVAGAVVRVVSNVADVLRFGAFRPQGMRLEHPDQARTTTGLDGRFTLRGLWPGEVKVAISADGLLPRDIERAVSDAAPTDLGDLELVVGETLRGVVVDDAGRPLPFVSLGLSEHGRPIISGGSDMVMFLPDDAIEEELTDWVGVRVVTGEGGRFEFHHVGAPKVTLWAAASGCEAERFKGVDVSHEARLVLRPTGAPDGDTVGVDRR